MTIFKIGDNVIVCDKYDDKYCEVGVIRCISKFGYYVQFATNSEYQYLYPSTDLQLV